MNDAPFIKVEVSRKNTFIINNNFFNKATKYTEIGYHGKNVDDIIKDLTSSAVKQSKSLLKIKVDKKKEEVLNLFI